MNELQAVHGFLELGEIKKAQLEMRQAFVLVRRLRKIAEAANLENGEKKKGGKS